MIDAIGAVESVKAASDIYAPVSGIIEAINETLADQPSLLNKKPQSDGMSLYSFFFPISRPKAKRETKADP
jgi:glycine cleavage system H lipoate-binding protein